MEFTNTVQTAKDLLGHILVHESPQGITSGIIVETEAYLSEDIASHSHKGLTKRNAAMFGEPGTVYVYFTYGMHHCFNIVTNKPGVGEAVLIRALQPLEGIDIMRYRRKRTQLKDLCSGPAKLVQAMGITMDMNGECLSLGRIFLCPKTLQQPIIRTTRIGIRNAKELPLRFYFQDNQFVSKL